MTDLELIELYPSPYSERVRWVLDAKNVSYRRRGYQPIADEAGLRQQTGLSTVPVLLANGDVVGDALTRADVTVATMLAPAFGHPPEELFSLDAPMRSMFGLPLADDAAVTPLRRWRDDLYRRHRGRRVVPD